MHWNLNSVDLTIFLDVLFETYKYLPAPFHNYNKMEKIWYTYKFHTINPLRTNLPSILLFENLSLEIDHFF